MAKLISSLYILFFRLRGIRISKPSVIKPTVFLSLGFLNGKKGAIDIAPQCELSRGVIIKAYGGHINIDSNTFLGEYVCIYGHGGVEIGKNTLIAMHTCIVSSNHTVPNKKTLIRSQGDILLPVKIGSDVWIGADVKILGGVTIGDGCVVGAGSIVTKSLPPYAIAMGVPAKITRYRND
jgi:acetyltransferase-like isoleucine patch superfamily enzyme